MSSTRIPTRTALVVSVLAALCIVLSACNQEGTPMSWTPESPIRLHEAKDIALTIESRIAQQVPDEFVLSRKHLENAPLLSCDSGENDFVWPGQMSLYLQHDPDIASLFTQIANDWNKAAGYRASLDRLPDGDPQVVINAKDGGEYFVDFWPKKFQIEISSFSPCFHLPEGNNGDDY
jgi:hypothetical protein